MSVFGRYSLGEGFHSVSSSSFTMATNRPVKAGDRCIASIAIANGANRRVDSLSGGGVTWTLIASRGTNNNSGAVYTFLSTAFPADVSTSVTITANITDNSGVAASTGNKLWALRSVFANAVDQSDVGAAGSTGSLVTSALRTLPGLTAIPDEYLFMATFIDQQVAYADVVKDPDFDFVQYAIGSGFGTLVFQERILTAQDSYDAAIAWSPSGRSASVLAALQGTFVAPDEIATPSGASVIFGIGLNFADDSFPDHYAELESADEFSHTVPDPIDAPILSQQNQLGSLVPPGDYYVAYSYSDGTYSIRTQETLISPVAHITVVAPNNKITVTLPVIPVGVADILVYFDVVPFVTGAGHIIGSTAGTSLAITGWSGVPSPPAFGNPSANTNSWPNKGGINRKFKAARINYSIDSTLFPSGYSPLLSGPMIEAYRDGAGVAYQNGHPKYALRGVDAVTYPDWVSSTTYTAGDHVTYNNLRYTALVGSTNQTPDQGSQGLGTTYWAPYGTFWSSIQTGVYDDVFIGYWDRIAAARGSHGNPLWRSTMPWIYSVAHEQSNASDTTPNGPGAGTPSQYGPMFDHLYDICVANGYHISVGGPIALAFIPTWSQYAADSALSYAPRDSGGAMIYSLSNGAYTYTNLRPTLGKWDFGGGDVYSHKTTQLYDHGPPIVRQACLDAGVPMIMPEFGVDAANGDDFVVDYLQRLNQDARQWGSGWNPGSLYMMCVTSKIASGGDFRVNASAKILQEWRRFALDEFWGGHHHMEFFLDNAA